VARGPPPDDRSPVPPAQPTPSPDATPRQRRASRLRPRERRAGRRGPARPVRWPATTPTARQDDEHEHSRWTPPRPATPHVTTRRPPETTGGKHKPQRGPPQ